MNPLKLALDWTPNINHIGFFVAKEKGFYKSLGIELDIINPAHDNYALTPAKKVELGKADFALCPTESIISYQTKEKPFNLIAIGAIFQEDVSAIVVKSSSTIKRPRGLDGKSYSSYKARYEDAIIKEMIKNDGGKGDIKIIYPEKLGIWNTLLEDVAHSTWIFMNWEGVEAEQSAIPFNYFKMKDYGVPYSYSPVIACGLTNASKKPDQISSFLKATREGFLYCKDHPDNAVAILSKYLSEEDKTINLRKALNLSLPYFGSKENLDFIDEKVIADFVAWIKANNLETKDINPTDLYTNNFFN